MKFVTGMQESLTCRIRGGFFNGFDSHHLLFLFCGKVSKHGTIPLFFPIRPTVRSVRFVRALKRKRLINRLGLLFLGFTLKTVIIICRGQFTVACKSLDCTVINVGTVQQCTDASLSALMGTFYDRIQTCAQFAEFSVSSIIAQPIIIRRIIALEYPFSRKPVFLVECIYILQNPLRFPCQRNIPAA